MSNSSGDAGPDVVKANEPRAAAEAPDRGDGGPAKSGPKRPPRPGTGVRPDEDGDAAAKPSGRAGRPADSKANETKANDTKPRAAKPSAKKAAAKTSAPQLSDARPTPAGRPPLRRRSGPDNSARPDAALEANAPATGREAKLRPGTRPTDGPAARQNPVPSRSAVAPSVVGSDRDATRLTERPVGAAPAPAARGEIRPEAPLQARPAASAPTDRRRGRRVKRVIRRIELWSVLKLVLFLLTCLYVAVLGTLVVIWGVAYSSGQIDNLQKFLADVGLENYRFYGDRMFKAAAAIGAVGVLAGTVLAVLTTALINLISEITGGIRVVVIEEDPPPRR